MEAADFEERKKNKIDEIERYTKKCPQKPRPSLLQIRCAQI